MDRCLCKNTCEVVEISNPEEVHKVEIPAVLHQVQRKKITTLLKENPYVAGVAVVRNDKRPDRLTDWLAASSPSNLTFRLNGERLT